MNLALVFSVLFLGGCFGTLLFTGAAVGEPCSWCDATPYFICEDLT